MFSVESAVRPSPIAHGTLRRALHWTTAGGVAAAFVFVLTRELVEDPSWDRTLLDLHRGIGLVVLALTLLRFVHHVTEPMPKSGVVDRRLHLAALAVHSALLGLLLALPVLGWAATNAAGKAVKLLGTVPLPTIAPHDRDLADFLVDVHSAGAWALAALVAAHVGAALWHHFVRRDETLTTMLPLRRIGGSTEG